MSAHERHDDASELAGSFDRASAAQERALRSSFGLYVHVPFCVSRCDYCAFATWTGREGDIDAYVQALCRELKEAVAEPGWRSPDTVFFGGGTPSLLEPRHFAAVLSVAQPCSDAEITVECNPESIAAPFVKGLVALGVNRISLGVQSRKPHVLKGLGRTYVEGAFERARAALGQAGLGNYNVDLMLGGASERDVDVVESLEEVLGAQLPPAHVSVYALTVEPGTPLAADRDRHPDEDDQARRYELVDDLLEAAGLSSYEVSNWARPGFECRHNLSCWLGGEYRGVGCAAHSHMGGERFSNVVSLDRYLAAVAGGRSPRARSERLGTSEREFELLSLRLRTRFGVPGDALPADCVSLGLVRGEQGRFVLTRRGRLLANEVSLRLQVPGHELIPEA